MQTSNFMLRYLPVILLFAIGSLLLLLVNTLTEDQILQNEHEYQMQILSSVLDGTDKADFNHLTIKTNETGSDYQESELKVYQQIRDKEIIAIALYPIIARGYIDSITLVIGISMDNKITAIKVIEENETDGIGDQVNSTWLDQFSGIQLDTMTLTDWAVKKEQGKFDAISGATITSRGVINAVHKTANFHALRRKNLYSFE